MSTAPHRLLLTTDAVGGVWTHALELAAALSARDVAVELAVLGPAATPAQIQAASLPGVTLHATGLALDWTVEDPAALEGISAALAALARRLNVDLVQLHSPALLGKAHWPAPVLAVAHSCVGTWWEAMRGAAPPPADFAWRMAAMRHGLQTADAVVAPSRAFADALRRVYGTSRRIVTVHNGRAPRAEPGMLGEGVLAAGRLWDEGKNIASLDSAAAMMPLAIRAAGATAGVNGTYIHLQHIQALGTLDEPCMAAAMDAARIFAAPALYEPFGLAVLEAAQAGLTLVLSDIPTFRELWDGAAIFVQPRDPAAWAQTLTALHDDAAECTRRGEQARARAASYTAESFGAAMWSQLCRTAARQSAAA